MRVSRWRAINRMRDPFVMIDATHNSLCIRPATAADAEAMLPLIRSHAAYEHGRTSVSAADLRSALDSKPACWRPGLPGRAANSLGTRPRLWTFRHGPDSHSSTSTACSCRIAAGVLVLEPGYWQRFAPMRQSGILQKSNGRRPTGTKTQSGSIVARGVIPAQSALLPVGAISALHFPRPPSIGKPLANDRAGGEGSGLDYRRLRSPF